MKCIYWPALLLIVFFQPVAVHSQTAFYIAASGNDDWSGKIAKANTNSTDGPFQSFERAAEAIAELNRKHQLPGKGITVFIRGGVYPVSKTMTLNNASAGKKNQPVIWKAWPGEKVELVGGRKVEGFHPLTNEHVRSRINKAYQKNIVEINLQNAGITEFGTITNRGGPGLELFFNNKKMQPARWPDTGWATIEDVPQTGELVNKGELPHMRFGIPVGRHYGRFSYRDDNPSNWSDIKNISLHGYWVWNWFDEYLRIQSIDTAKKEIYIKPPHSQYGYCKEQRFYAANVLEELDQPGEWYIDRATGMLLFWPPSAIDSADVFVSLLNEPMILLENTANIRVEGISFEFSQGSGVVIKGGENNRIAGCSFNNLGNTAVRIEGGKNNGLVSSDIYNVALGGVQLSGGDRSTLSAAGNYVANNHIHDFAQWIRTYQPGIVVSGVGNYMAHNLIHNGPGTGILLTGNEHIIEYNDLHHLALETGDVGAFYMGRDWTERGNIIRYNFFHDLKGPGNHDVNAVYLDDWASGTTVLGNIFTNCARGIMIGGGRDNTITNNLFIDCHPAIHVDARGLGWAKYYFDGTDNTLFTRMDAMKYKQPPYSEKYPVLLSLYTDEPAVAKNNKINRNIAYLGRWMDLFDGLDYTIVESKNNILGKPTEGVLSKADFIVPENPGIANYSDNDFRLQSKAFAKGFKKIPYNKIGLQKDVFRTKTISNLRIK